MKNLNILLLFVIFFYNAQSQTTINYQTWSGGGACNLFTIGNNVPCTVDGVNSTKLHITNIGQPRYSSIDNAVTLDCDANSGIKGTKYEILNNFKKDYRYKIIVNASRIQSSPSSNAVLVLDINNGGNGGNSFCNGSGQVPVGGGSAINNSIFSNTFSDYNYNFSSPLSQNLTSLVVYDFSPAGSTLQTVFIRKITIQEFAPAITPVSFTLPTSTSITCGNLSDKIFTVTNVNNTSGVTSYTWNLGIANNGWLYNSSPAPQTILTFSNTITLTPQCGINQQNVFAEVIANGNTYTTNTCNVVVSPPAIYINGNGGVLTSENYNILRLPCNSTVSWSVSPAGIVDISCVNCSQTTLNRIGEGPFMLSAIVNSCGISTTINGNLSACNPIGNVPSNVTATLGSNNGMSGFYINFNQVANISNYQMDIFDLTTNRNQTQNISIQYSSSNNSSNFYYYLTQGHSYKFRVQTVGGPCNNPESDWSLPVIFDPSCTPPTTLNLSNNGGGNVAFSWSSPSSTLYEIEYNLINVSQGLNQVYPISGSSNPINYNVNVQSGMGWTISFKVRFRCPNGTMSNWSLQSAQFSL